MAERRSKFSLKITFQSNFFTLSGNSRVTTHLKHLSAKIVLWRNLKMWVVCVCMCVCMYLCPVIHISGYSCGEEETILHSVYTTVILILLLLIGILIFLVCSRPGNSHGKCSLLAYGTLPSCL